MTLCGCLRAHPPNGAILCGAPEKACPDGYHCAFDGTCWQDGQDPPQQTTVDMSIGPADFAAPRDLALLPIDFAIPDGNHLGHIAAASGGATNVSGTGTHRASLSVMAGSGTAKGSANTIQFGVLPAALAK